MAATAGRCKPMLCRAPVAKRCLDHARLDGRRANHMLLTLNARRSPALPSRRGPLRAFAIVAAICVGATSAIVIRHAVAPAEHPLEQPVWAGSIGTGVDGPLVMPSRETSASYTSPVVIQAASDAAARSVRSCGPDGACPPLRAAKALVPPRRPALPSVVAGGRAERPRGAGRRRQAEADLQRRRPDGPTPLPERAPETVHGRGRYDVRADQAVLTANAADGCCTDSAVRHIAVGRPDAPSPSPRAAW